MSVILALDQGTTSSRAIIFDSNSNKVAVAQREFAQIYPRPGWVEHDPEEIWSTQMGVATEALSRAGLGPADVAGIGITNQRETTIVWERRSGRPVCNAIVWQDRRTAPLIDRLRANGSDAVIRRNTGLEADAYFSASKIAWILDNVDGARAMAERGELAFGTVDSWLVWKLTGGALHATDPSNASRTMLFDIHKGDWDDELLALFGVPRSILPEVRPSSGVFGETSSTLLARPVPIAGIAGDQQAALFGQIAFTRGMAKCTYGTGCFMLMNTGAEPVASRHRLLTTVGWRVGEQTAYALEGSVFIGGAVVQWLRDGLGLIRAAADVETLANSVGDNGGVYLVPAFSGLGAPHWDQYARGTICGLTRGTNAGHIARAALEAIAFQVADLHDAMRNDAGVEIPELRVDGGATANDTLLQIQADILQAPVVRPAEIETTALGAAYLAGLAVGFWKDTDELFRHWSVSRRFEPRLPADQVQSMRTNWRRAVERARDWEATNPSSHGSD